MVRAAGIKILKIMRIIPFFTNIISYKICSCSAIFLLFQVKGLYKGMSSPIAGVAAVNAIVFGIYGNTLKQLPEPDRLSAHLTAGVFAGLAQTIVTSPIELAKTRVQLLASSHGSSYGPMQCLRNIYKQEGYRGIFKGLGVTFLREGPSYGVYFVTYKFLTTTSSKEPASTLRTLLAGGFAGVASWVISYPVDVVKSRIQAESSNRYSGILDCLKKSVRAEGYKCLFRGLNTTILRAFPTNATTFAVYTWTFQLFSDELKESKETPKKEEITSMRKCKISLKEYEIFINENSFFEIPTSDLTTVFSYPVLLPINETQNNKICLVHDRKELHLRSTEVEKHVCRLGREKMENLR